MGTNKKTHVILGDLSFLHDVNALSLVRRISEKISLNIFMVNNAGGEIFRMIMGDMGSERESIFTTPQMIDFSALAMGFGLNYVKIDRVSSLKDFLHSQSGSGVQCIELLPDSKKNTMFRKKFWQQLESS